MRDIFISYVEEDNRVTTQLAEGLEAAGYSTWYYERDGVPGASYLLQTRSAIDGCQAVLLLISPDSVQSEQVTLEVVRAHESNKKFIPLRTKISHANFVAARPEWAQALGAATSIEISPEDAHTVVPRLLVGLRKMNLLPRPDLVTNEMSVLTPEMIRGATNEPAAPARPTPVPPAAEPAAGPRRNLLRPAVFAVGAVVAALALVGATMFLRGGSSRAKAEPPLTAAPVREEFLTLQAWTHPPNWAVGQGALQLAEAPQPGFLTATRVRDFTMSFQVTLTNGGGAAWALRVRDGGYYLFYLSGPKGLQPNRFLTYRVQGDKMEQVGTAFNAVRPLLEGGVYTILIKAEKNNLFHQIRIDSAPDSQFEGETNNLGSYTDNDDLFPNGSIGFRTFGNETFAVADLFVYPPGTKPLQ